MLLLLRTHTQKKLLLKFIKSFFSPSRVGFVFIYILDLFWCCWCVIHVYKYTTQCCCYCCCFCLLGRAHYTFSSLISFQKQKRHIQFVCNIVSLPHFIKSYFGTALRIQECKEEKSKKIAKNLRVRNQLVDSSRVTKWLSDIQTEKLLRNIKNGNMITECSHQHTIQSTLWTIVHASDRWLRKIIIKFV